MKKITLSLLVVASLFLVACEPTATQSGSFQEQSAIAEQTQQRVEKAVPVPQIDSSEERKNVAKRAELFNSEDKISYIYLVNYGKVMAFYTVKGKVSSLRSYMTPQEKMVFGNGSPCDEGDQWGSSDDSADCYSVEAPDIDGTYGENIAGIFFFTTEGAYVEWNGDYMMSDQPLRLTTPPELVREIE